MKSLRSSNRCANRLVVFNIHSFLSCLKSSDLWWTIQIFRMIIHDLETWTYFMNYRFGRLENVKFASPCNDYGRRLIWRRKTGFHVFYDDFLISILYVFVLLTPGRHMISYEGKTDLHRTKQVELFLSRGTDTQRSTHGTHSTQQKYVRVTSINFHTNNIRTQTHYFSQ